MLDEVGEYLKQVFLGPVKLAVLVILPVLGTLGFFAKNKNVGIISVIGGFLIAVAFNSIWTGFSYYKQGLLPIKVRDTRVIQDFDGTNVIIVLDRRSWIEFGQVLLLKLYFGSVPSNIGLIEINRRTDDRFPCAIMTEAYVEDAEELLLDHSRLGSFKATPITEQRR